MSKPKRYYELNYFNAIACLFVILIHVLSLGITSLRADSWQMALIYFPWKFAAYVVPGFLFTGALKMALGFGGEGENGVRYFPYIWRRITKIYIPYVLWVVVYYLYFLSIGWVKPGIMELLKYIWIGNLSAPFYYVIIVMQFYLLMPLWKWMVKKVPFFVAMPIAALVTMFMYRFGEFLSHFGISFEWSGRLFPTFLIFWVMGLYVGKYYDDVRDWLKQQKNIIYASLLWVGLYLILAFYQQATAANIVDIGVLKVFTDCITIIAMLALCIALNDRGAPFIKNILRFVYAASFTVFLSHCLFLEAGQSLLRRIGVGNIGVSIIVRALICYTLPFLLWFAYHKIKKLLKR